MNEPDDVQAAKAAIVRAKAGGDTLALTAAWEALRAARANHAATALQGLSAVPVQMHADGRTEGG